MEPARRPDGLPKPNTLIERLLAAILDELRAQRKGRPQLDEEFEPFKRVKEKKKS